MGSFSVLTQALGYIEENLCTSITPEDTAQHCAYSLSGLQKMFKRTFHLGIADYITRRRITAASRDLLETDDTILDIALKYGYNSHEVFSRAFVRIWGETPSVYRKERHFADIYPKLNLPVSFCDAERGDVMMKQNFDISQLYDYLKEMNGTYVLSFDIKSLMPINDNYGSAAGDLAIAECLKRIDSGKDEGMIMLRIGGDEFILLTGTSDIDAAKTVANRILAHNGETVTYKNDEIEVSMRCGMMIIESEKAFRYSEFFTKMVELGHSDGELS